MKYFHEIHKGGHVYYRVRRQIQNKEYMVIWTRSKPLALQCYHECKQYKWEPEKLLELREKYRQQKPIRPNQYIQPDDKGGYRVCKWTKGRVKYYGKAQTLEHARKIRDYLIEKGWTRPVYTKPEVSPTRGIQRLDNGKYRILHKQQHYGTFNTYNEAIQERRRQQQEGWKQRRIKAYGQNNPYRHVYKTPLGKYTVKKKIDGVVTYFAQCSTIEEAVEERDFFESINWDWDMLDLY